jgi:predicted dienelactone hydrolase
MRKSALFVIGFLLLSCSNFEDEPTSEIETETNDALSGGDLVVDIFPDTIDQDTQDQETDANSHINPDMEPAGDYSEPGSWTAGQLWSDTLGSSGNILYISTWFPSSDTGAEETWYGGDDWWNQGESYTDVTPACDEPRPVIVHSHGDSSLSWEMYYLAEFLATHGWITVAPDHTGNTAYDNTEPFETLLVRRPLDIQSTYDWLLDQNADPESALYGCVDPDAGYVTTGFSFGGYTAYANGGAALNDEMGQPTVDYSDPRVRAIITYAPWDGFYAITSGTSQITVPVMTIGGQMDETLGTQYILLFAPIESTPRLLGDIDRGGHLSFTPIYCQFVTTDGCGIDFIALDTFTDALKTAVISWLEYLNGRPGAIDQIQDYPGELTWTLTE